MSRNQIGKITIVPVREAFAHEALDFTVWLEQNIDALAERLGLDLTVVEREKAVGSFNVDLLCEDGNGNTVIIENQLERTDHDHLGKLLTYMINLDARTAIWVTTDPRHEHEKVVDWLNETTGTNMAFYLVKVEAIRIGESPYAPLFTVLAAPDDQIRELGETKREFAERHGKRLEFWQTLIERSRDRTKLFANRSPSRDHWLGIGAGRSGLTFNYLIFKDKAGLELYIDTGDYDRNKAIFDALLEQQEQIEQSFGAPLDWQRLDDRRASRIAYFIRGKGSLNEVESWPEVQDLMIDAMIRFERVFRPRIKQIEV